MVWGISLQLEELWSELLDGRPRYNRKLGMRL